MKLLANKTYVGTVINGQHDVYVATPRGSHYLNPRHDLYNHSPDGFCWGYGGSGPSQLALAILADLYDDDTATWLYQDFKARIIAALDTDSGFRLSEAQVRACIDQIKQERKAWQPS